MNQQAIKQALLQQYPYRVELHAHTAPVSGCSEVSPAELIDIYAAQGVDAVVITNHFTYHEGLDPADYVNTHVAAFEQAKAHAEQYGMQVYLGAEIRFTENVNDYLVYGVDRQQLLEIYDYLPHGIERFRREYAMPDSVFVQAHPKRDHMTPVDAALLDGVEVFNMHQNHNSRVGLAALFAREKDGMIVTIGSDFHHPHREHEAQGLIRVSQLPKDGFALAALLRSGEYVMELARGYLVI